MDYEKAYKILFNEITIAIRTIEQSKVLSQDIMNGLDILKKAQQTTENVYMVQT